MVIQLNLIRCRFIQISLLYICNMRVSMFVCWCGARNPCHHWCTFVWWVEFTSICCSDFCVRVCWPFMMFVYVMGQTDRQEYGGHIMCPLACAFNVIGIAVCLSTPHATVIMLNFKRFGFFSRSFVIHGTRIHPKWNVDWIEECQRLLTIITHLYLPMYFYRNAIFGFKFIVLPASFLFCFVRSLSNDRMQTKKKSIFDWLKWSATAAILHTFFVPTILSELAWTTWR